MSKLLSKGLFFFLVFSAAFLHGYSNSGYSKVQINTLLDSLNTAIDRKYTAQALKEIESIPKNILDKAPDYDKTPIEHAVMAGNEEVVKALIAKGVALKADISFGNLIFLSLGYAPNKAIITSILEKVPELAWQKKTFFNRLKSAEVDITPTQFIAYEAYSIYEKSGNITCPEIYFDCLFILQQHVKGDFENLHYNASENAKLSSYLEELKQQYNQYLNKKEESKNSERKQRDNTLKTSKKIHRKVPKQ